MNIAIDVDDVLREFVNRLVQQYKKDFPSHRVLTPIDDWDMSKHFPDTGKEIIHYFKDIRPREVFELAKPVKHANWLCDALKQDGHTIWLVTAQKHGNEIYTLNWITKNKISYDHICFTSDKSKIGCDILIDDGVHNLEAFREKGGIGVCMNQPWNQEWDGERVNSLEEFYSLVGTYQREYYGAL